MNKLQSIIILLFFAFASANAQQNIFHYNTLGYLPNSPKQASISKEFETFDILDAKSGKSVYNGKADGPYSQSGFDINVWIADFSELDKSGTYILKLNSGEKSPEFKIASDVYNFAFETSMRAFYLWRCGTAVEGEFNGNTYTHKACHLNDGYLDYIGQTGEQKDGTGGWHDAGDHGKYIVNASITVGLLFYAWEHFNENIQKIDLNLPETAPGYPEFLKELKWETDWILKMAYPDGSGRVSHKLTRTNFSGFIMPDDDHEKRYYTQWSSAATAGYVGMLAQAARFFKPYDKKYAQKCLDAATISYTFLSQNPEHKPFERGDFHTGGYQSNDADDRIWAAAEMWETTGDKKYLADFEAKIQEQQSMVDENWDWGNIKNMGVFTYLMSKREGKNPELFNSLKQKTIETANQIVNKAQSDIFNRPLGNKHYWGSNGTVARQVLNLQIANKLEPNKQYQQTALDAIHYLFGRNYYARSQVTGLGYMPPMNPHDRRSGADNIVEPWPGYIVGGGTKATNWEDIEASYSTNEVAINWQAALVYALAGFINK